MSGVGWVDFSSTDRARVQEVLALLKEKGTLDELGIGQVRDAFSDRLFPGFSTIQTTARYFLAVPKILRDWAAMAPRQRRAKPLMRYLEEAENKLAIDLVKNHELQKLPLDGIIGHTLIESGGAARKPSSTYWNGLRVFNIVRTQASLAEFCREWRQEDHDLDAVDSEHGADDASSRFDADVKLPPATPLACATPEGLTLRLSPAEAKFLSSHFQMASGQKDSVAAQLLSHQLAGEAIDMKHQRFSAFSVWAAQQEALSQRCRALIANAQRFSLAIEGAHIVFNNLVAKRLEHEVLRKRCEEEFSDWNQRARQAGVFHEAALAQWLDAGDSQVKWKASCFQFLREWNAAHCRGASSSELDKLVEKQAKANKQGRSLLVRLPRQVVDWYGMKELDYRWPTARRMLSDIEEAQVC